MSKINVRILQKRIQVALKGGAAWNGIIGKPEAIKNIDTVVENLSDAITELDEGKADVIHTHEAVQVFADPFQTPAFANPLVLDATLHKDFKCGTITGNTTINLINSSNGDAGMIELLIDGTGSYTVDLGAMFTKCIGGELSTEANADNFISWRNVAGDIVYSIQAAFSWSSYWTTRSLFFAETKYIVDGKLYNRVAGRTSEYLIVTGDETYTCPINIEYITSDTDHVWFNADQTPRIVTTSDLINFDFVRTIVKYDDNEPYTIRTIMILSSDISIPLLNKLHKDFRLSLFWSGVLNSSGYLKGNKGFNQIPWDGYNSDELLVPHETLGFVANDFNKWVVNGNNIKEQDGRAVKFTYVNNDTGGQVYLRLLITATLFNNLTIGDQIKVIIRAKVISGGYIRLGGAVLGPQIPIGVTDFEEKIIYYTVDSVNTFFRVDGLGAGRVAWVEFISIRKKII